MTQSLDLANAHADERRAGATGFSWSQAVHNRPARVTGGALRIWMVTIAGLVCVRGIMLLSRTSFESAVPAWLDALMSIGTISLALALALRPARGRFAEHTVALQAGLMTVAAAFTFTLGAAVPDYGTEPMHAAIIVLMVGFAMLMPLPWRLGLPALAATALVYPFTLLALDIATPDDLLLAAQVVDLSVGFSVSSLVLVVHNRLFASRSHALRELVLLAEHDALTGLYNRRTFMARLAAETNRSERYGLPLALLIFDIDNFKRFNTEYGYAAGDLMLRKVAKSLEAVTERPHFADVDIAVARYGGEEFIALIPDTELALLKRFADEAREAVDALRVELDREVLQVTTSSGYVLFPGGLTTQPEQLIRAADVALYEAKSLGGNAAVHANVDFDALAKEPVGPPLSRANSIARQSAQYRISRSHASLAQDNNRLHWLVLQWTLGITAFWVLLVALMDFALLVDERYHLPLSAMLLGRGFLFTLLLVMALKAPLMRRVPHGLTITHAVYIAIMIAATFGMADLTGGVVSPYFPQIVHVICAWTLAFAVRPAWSATMLVAIVVSYPSLYVFRDGLSLATPELFSRTAVLACAGAVSLATQNVFARLRREELEARRTLIRLARVDPLTGLPNRAAFEERLERLLLRATKDAPLSLIVLDLDHFKRLNDTLGHLVGDDALAMCAATLEATVRIADTACRLGGEEFAVALPVTDREGAALSAERLRQRIGDIRVGPNDTALSASFGVVESRESDTVSSLLSRADLALRRAKLEGRNRVVTD